MSKSQTETILEHLQSGKTLTKAECWEKFKIMNCGGRISELRNRGHKIETVMVISDETGNEHAVYFIPQKKQQAPVVNGNQFEMSI